MEASIIGFVLLVFSLFHATTQEKRLGRVEDKYTTMGQSAQALMSKAKYQITTLAPGGPASSEDPAVRVPTMPHPGITSLLGMKKAHTSVQAPSLDIQL